MSFLLFLKIFYLFLCVCIKLISSLSYEWHMRSPLILLTFDFIEGIFFLPYKCLNILSFYIYPSFFFFFSFLFSLSMAVIYILFLCLSKTYLTLKSLFVKTIFVFFSLSTFWTNIASWANHRSASERGEERQNRKKKTMAVVYATPRQLGTDDLTGKTIGPWEDARGRYSFSLGPRSRVHGSALDLRFNNRENIFPLNFYFEKNQTYRKDEERL